MTSKELNDLLKEGTKPVMGSILLKNSVKISVQASDGHYYTPRNNIGPWTEVEVGFPPTEPPETWKEYFDGDWENQNHTESVYGYVPIELVVDYINLLEIQ